ncbi:MAG: serine/threonine-protein kinase [Microcoleaceae cyanobacterium]
MSQLLDGRYQILEVLESSELGTAYLAQDIRRPGESLCFVKHLHLAAEDPQLIEIARRRFQQEAQTLEKLSQHDQIPKLLAYFEEYQDFYMIESYISGQSLLSEIVPGYPLSELQVTDILKDVLEILSFIHQKGVIHRDIKPSNIIRRDSDHKLVLIDFGAIKEINLEKNHNPPTARIGTIEYMPIEQFECDPQFNSDIYALGMIAIQALTGIPIYELRKLREKNKSNSTEIVWQHLAIVSPEFAELLDQMIRYDYRDRYQSAENILLDLKRIRYHSQTLTSRQETYREEVQRCASNRGDISIVGRRILEELRLNLELSLEEVEAIEDEILNPYRKYQEKGERYEQAVIAAVKQQYPFPPETWEELKRLQHILGLNETDASYIESQVLPRSWLDNLWRINRQKIPQKNITQRFNSGNFFKSIRSIPIIIGLIFLTLLGLIFAGYQYLQWQEVRRQQQQLEAQEIERIQMLLNQERYNDCVSEAANIPENSSQYLNAQSLIKKCQDAINWRLATPQELGQHLGAVGTVAFSPDGSILATGSRDQTIKLWNLETGDIIGTLTGDGSPIWSLDFSSSGSDLAAGSYYWRILEWNLETGETYIPLQQNGAVWSVKISPDERLIASASSDQTVKIWDRQSGFILYDFLDHDDIVYAVDWTPNGRILVSASKDKTVKVFDVETGTVLLTLTGHSDQVRSIVISSDGNTLVTGSYDDTIKIWNLITGELIHTLTGHSGDILSVDISPDNQLIVSGSKDQTIKLWNRQTGELLSTLIGHNSEVYAVRFSPDGQTIASGGKDRTVKLWRR